MLCSVVFGEIEEIGVGTRTWIRWAVLHGAPRPFLSLQARRGQPFARLLVGPQRGGDPYPLIEQIRAGGSVTRIPFVSMTADHELCRTILRDNRFGVNTPTNPGLRAAISWLVRQTDLQLPNPLEPPSMLSVDPPDHTRYRQPVAQAFTPRAVEKMRGRVTEVTNELLDRLESKKYADLISDFAAPLPVAIIAEVLGVPEELRPRLLGLGDRGAPLFDFGLSWKTFRNAMAALREADQYFGDHVDRLRAEPGDDIFSQVILGGDTFTRRELAATGLLVVAAGFETIVNLIGNAIVLLLQNPSQLTRLREEPQLWPDAVEEILRLDPPAHMTARTATCDVQLVGHPIAAGEMIALLLAGANRDPTVFTNPDQFDITRPNAKDHLSFSSGIHACLGASLARMEATIALRALFERFPGLRLDGTPTPRELATLHGFRCVPVKLAT
jgi:cytochrome P450